MERAQSYWDRNASRYDIASYLLNNKLDLVAKRVADLIPLKSQVLEVGCGTGIFTNAIASKTTKLVATDISQSMLNLTKERLKAEGVKNVTLLKQDANSIHDLGKFDVLLAANLLHILPDPKTFLQRANDAIVPGGIIIAPTFLHKQTLFTSLTSQILKLQGLPLVNKFSENSLRQLFFDSSFEVVHFEMFKGLLPIGLYLVRPRAASLT